MMDDIFERERDAVLEGIEKSHAKDTMRDDARRRAIERE
jgi:hypothetical protein